MKERAPILLKRSGRFLVAASAPTERFIEDLPQGVTLRARSITRPRSRPRLNLYWTLIDLVSENLEDIPSAALHEWVKMRLGLVVAIPLRSGGTDMVPASISFESMSEEDFGPFLDRVIDLLTTHIIPGMGRQDLLDMASEILGGPR